MYSLRYTPEAVRDMDLLWDDVYEASKDFDTADRYVREFDLEISKKKKYPLTGNPLVYRGLFTGFYYVNFKKYMAFYRVKGEFIEVIRIIMSKRDYMSVLFGEINSDNEDEDS